jgi:NAD-dependent dihydropyrimidine dehydrogenase PreA subunit
MTTNNDYYQQLAEKIGAAGYPRYIRIMENQLTPIDAAICVGLADGVPPAHIAKKLNMEENILAAKIQELVNKRFVLQNKDSFRIPRDPRFFPRGPDTPRTRELWLDFFHSGDYPRIHVEAMKERTKITGKPRHKVIPARQALLASPGLNPKYILWYEDLEQIFRRAAKRFQGGLKEDGTLGKREESGCGCRRLWSKCEYSGGCTGWVWQPGEWGTDGTVRAPSNPRPARREITVAEALAAIDEMENTGMVHISPNTGQITSTCNCCPCCCEVLHAGNLTGQIHEILAPSRYLAVIDLEKCSGCQTCVERCHFHAIEMRKSPNSKKLKAFVINDECMGCGLCIFKCPNQAMTLELVRPPEHIPSTPFLSPNTLEGNAAGRM